MSTIAAPITVRIDPLHKKNLDKIASITSRSRSYVINQAIENYLQENVAYLQDLEEALAEIKEQPTHDSEKVFSWMKTWGKDDELKTARN